MPRAQIKRTWQVNITAKFGSETQAQVAEEMLKGFLQAMEIYLKGAHQRNELIVSFNPGLFDTPKPEKPKVVENNEPVPGQGQIL